MGGWCEGAGFLSVPWRPTNLDNRRAGSTVRTVGAGWVVRICFLSPIIPHRLPLSGRWLDLD